MYIQYIYIYTEYRGIVPHFAGAKRSFPKPSCSVMY